MYPIVQAPNQILRTPAETVSLPAEKLAKIISGMTATLLAQKDPEGVGLAANQVNLPYKLFLARFEVKKTAPVHVFINPEIVARSDDFQPEPDEKKPTMEGCLSLPNYYGVVQRWQWVKLKYQDENLKLKIENFRGFPAVVIQHEMDHLSGKIFVERILEQQGKLYKLSIQPAGSKTGRRTKSPRETWEEVEI